LRLPIGVFGSQQEIGSMYFCLWKIFAQICECNSILHAKYEFATLNTCSIASIVAMDTLREIPFSSSARGASFHTKHASNTNVVRVELLDANSYLALYISAQLNANINGGCHRYWVLKVSSAERLYYNYASKPISNLSQSVQYP
jgi:hypothetical protein